MLTIFLAIFVRLRSATEERLHLYLLIVVWLYISLGSKTHNYYIYFHILPRNRRHRIVIDAINTRAYTFSDDAPSIACTDFWGAHRGQVLVCAVMTVPRRKLRRFRRLIDHASSVLGGTHLV